MAAESILITLAVGAIILCGLASLPQDPNYQIPDGTDDQRSRLDLYKVLFTIEDEKFYYQLQRNGQIMRCSKEYTLGGYMPWICWGFRPCHGTWAKDSLFFELDGVIYLGNTRERRFERFNQEARVWCVIGEWDFLPKYKAFKDKQDAKRS